MASEQKSGYQLSWDQIHLPPQPHPAGFETRVSWQADQIDHSSNWRGVEVLSTSDSPEFLSKALASAVQKNRAGDGSITSDLSRALTQTSYWNDLAFGKDLSKSRLNGDPVVIAALDQHIGKTHELADTFIEWYPELAKTFERQLKHAVAEGYIPTEVLKRVEPALRYTSFKITDGLEWEVADIDAVGEYTPERDTITLSSVAIAAGYTWWTTKLFTHEIMHKLSGMTILTDERYVKRLGMADSITEKRSHDWLNEALTEHNAQTLINDDFDTVEPKLRYPDSQTYADERSLLARLIDCSEGNLDIKLFNGAYFEDNNAGEDGKVTAPARRALMRAMRNAYGPGALHKIDRLVNEYGAEFAWSCIRPGYISAPLKD